MTRIVFFGTPEFAVPFLKILASDPTIELVAVVTQTDKPVGRKQILTKPEVKVAAETLSIPVYQFPTLKSPEAEQALRDLNAEVFVVVAYGKLIPQSILDIPAHGCVNVHPSLLPKYQGPSPIQNALLNGDAVTGVSIMLLDAGMDTGPILAQSTIQLDPRETFTTLESKILFAAPNLLVETVHAYLEQELQAIPQDQSNASITNLLERIDGHIDWTQTAQSIDQKIRAFETWPGTWFPWNEDGQMVRVSIHKAQLTDRACEEPIGTCVSESGHVLVVCGDKNAIELLEIQPEGKNKMPAIDYVRGHNTLLTTNLIPS